MTNSNVLTERKARTRRMVQTAFLAALVFVMQILSYIVPIRVGIFSLSFVLIPIVVGGALLGPAVGAFLGAVFGLVTVIGCISGLDAGGVILLAANPILCVLLCLLKGTVAGWFSGLTFRAMDRALTKKKPASAATNYVSSLFSAAVCPVTNTLIFCVAMLTIFNEQLVAWAGGKPILVYMLTGLIGINFLLELGLNVVVCPILIAALRGTRFFRK